MHFPFLILNFFLAYVAASEVTIDDQKESKIRYTVNQIMRVIENEIKNQTIEQGSLSKRNYGFYPDILKQYYPKAYRIVKSGCDENNPYLYRPAPGGGFYHPAASAVYKREEAVDQDVDALTENVKIIQKQLAMEWEKLSSQYNSLTRRRFGVTLGGVAQSFAAGLRSSYDDASVITAASKHSGAPQNFQTTTRRPMFRNSLEIVGVIGIVIFTSAVVSALLGVLFTYLIPQLLD